MSSSADSARFDRLERLFEEATALPPAERARFLDEACAGDADLRGELDRMLAVDERAPEFLEYPSGDTASATAAGDAAPRAGLPDRIGPYAIVRAVAAGGMGVVYEARQERPARRVALKVLRPGMLGDQATRRFRYEAEVLGRLQDPRIAQVYEAGVHADDAGETPYIAMEFVDGVDVLQHARDARLDRRERLRLFLEVCGAVQHGHQHGVIHRDIKPSNVLVDSEGRVKLIDFGVARSVDPEGEADLTRAGELVGTLAYMAPEQLSGDPAQVDTRTDVHALGLLLYELVCERGPFELGGMSMTEVARVLRETEPLDPRAIEPDLPQDVAWVLLCALEKEPARRYASASELGEDVRRCLAHEPVQAGPPSRLYRARKFVRRNRLAVAAGAVVLLALVAGTWLALAGLLRARAEAAKFASINEVLTNMLVAVRAEEDGHDVRVRELLDRAAEQLGLRLADRPEVELALRRALAESYHSLGLEDEAAEQARVALELGARGGFATPTEELELDLLLASALAGRGELDEADARIASALARAPVDASAAATAVGLRRLDAWIESQRGDPERARTLLAELSAEAAGTLGEDHPATLLVDETLQGLLARSDTEAAARLGRRLMAARIRLDGPESYPALDRRLALAALLRTRGEYAEARELYEEALEPLHRLLGSRHPRFLTALHELALLYTETGERDRAMTLLEEVDAGRREILPADHPDLLAVESSLVNLRAKLGEASGVDSQRAVLDTRRRIFGADHPTTLSCMRDLAIGLVGVRAFDEAETLVLEYRERTRRALGPEHVESARAADLLGYLHYSRGDFAAAAPAFEEAWLGLSRTIGPESNQARRAASNFVATLGRLGRHEEAIPAATELLAVMRRVLGPEDPDLVIVHTNLAELQRRAGHTATALEMFAEVLDSAREHLPADHPHRALCAFNLGRTLLENGRREEAEALLAEAVAEAEYNAQVPPGDVADYRRTLADCLAAQGRSEEALEELLLAWEAASRAGDDGRARATARAAARVLEVVESGGGSSPWLERAPGDLRDAVEAERASSAGG